MENSHYNVGSSIDYSIKELAEKIAKIVGYRGQISWDISKPDGTAKKLLDSSRFLELGWKPEMNFDNGLAITYNWFKENYSNIVNK
jgi:GDP-L-fucose synthase